ncbi:S8 family serine peptidase, partial [candidate division KSB1 bacterium]|nr:S8 family serine peptidase [candidate division KSB1 bacterium]
MIQYFTRTIIAISVIVIAILFGRQKLERHRGRAYGDAFEQMQQLKVPAVHRAGIVGHGVRIGVIDSGFDRSHPALRSTQVRAEFDFIDNDSSTGQSARLNRHGTQVWSILAANDPGQMIGVAPEAEYVLAQAECEGESRTDCAREEKATIAAIDWLCDQQVDLITFSLCLLQREPPRRYLPQQMDGRSAPVTRRADQAFEQGVLFFAAAGNGFRRDWRIIEPPADGFRVVA